MLEGNVFSKGIPLLLNSYHRGYFGGVNVDRLLEISVLFAKPFQFKAFSCTVLELSKVDYESLDNDPAGAKT